MKNLVNIRVKAARNELVVLMLIPIPGYLVNVVMQTQVLLESTESDRKACTNRGFPQPLLLELD